MNLQENLSSLDIQCCASEEAERRRGRDEDTLEREHAARADAHIDQPGAQNKPEHKPARKQTQVTLSSPNSYSHGMSYTLAMHHFILACYSLDTDQP